MPTQENNTRPPQARILAIIPAYNEAARVAPVISTAGSFLPVLVVDDGSADETASVARALIRNRWFLPSTSMIHSSLRIRSFILSVQDRV